MDTKDLLHSTWEGSKGVLRVYKPLGHLWRAINKWSNRDLICSVRWNFQKALANPFFEGTKQPKRAREGPNLGRQRKGMAKVNDQAPIVPEELFRGCAGCKQ